MIEGGSRTAGEYKFPIFGIKESQFFPGYSWNQISFKQFVLLPQNNITDSSHEIYLLYLQLAFSLKGPRVN